SALHMDVMVVCVEVVGHDWVGRWRGHAGHPGECVSSRLAFPAFQNVLSSTPWALPNKQDQLSHLCPRQFVFLLAATHHPLLEIDLMYHIKPYHPCLFRKWWHNFSQSSIPYYGRTSQKVNEDVFPRRSA